MQIRYSYGYFKSISDITDLVKVVFKTLTWDNGVLSCVVLAIVLKLSVVATIWRLFVNALRREQAVRAVDLVGRSSPGLICLSIKKREILIDQFGKMSFFKALNTVRWVFFRNYRYR